MRAATWLTAWVGILSAACAGSGSSAPPDHYLRYSAFEMPGNEYVLLRWPHRAMPLRIHLPEPPPGLFEDPTEIFDVIRDGILDWTDVAAPGIPSFEFVDDPGSADIPIVWAADPSGGWYVAYCFYDIDRMARRFGVAHILVTGRWGDALADMHDIYGVMLHEMGHALGLRHSPHPEDVMSIEGPIATELSERDRRTLTLLYERPVGARIVGVRRVD